MSGNVAGATAQSCSSSVSHPIRGVLPFDSRRVSILRMSDLRQLLSASIFRFALTLSDSRLWPRTARGNKYESSQRGKHRILKPRVFSPRDLGHFYELVGQLV